MLICVFYFSSTSIKNMLGPFLNVVTWLTLLVLDLILYLCVPVLFTLMSLFCGFYTSGIAWGCGFVVSAFIFPNSHFWKKIPIFGVTAKFMLR